MTDAAARRLLRSLFDAAIAAADPRKVLPPHLPSPPRGRTVVVGAGKSAALMAQVTEAHYQAPLSGPTLSGVVVTRYGHAVPTRHIEVIEASHPVPDAAGEQAAQRILALTSPFTPDAQYRINLGAKLREAIEPNLGREVTVVGSGTHAGVYDRAAWAAIESGVDDAPLVDKIASLEWL